MSKIVKIKQKDIEGIVNNIISEQVEETTENVDNQSGTVLAIGVDENGTHYVMNAKTGEILGTK
jgi:hypothetical protein